MDRDLIKKLRPDGDLLLDILRDMVDDRLLRVIAEADYHQDAEQHFDALRAIRDDKIWPKPMGWHPSEVLELVRWSQPDDKGWRPGLDGAEGHIIRAFCCAALLRAQGEPDCYASVGGENQTAVQLYWSLDRLDRQCRDAGLRLLAWAIDRIDDLYEEEIFFQVAILALCLQREEGISPCDLTGLAREIIRQEDRIRQDENAVLPFGRDAGLFGLTYFDSQQRAWRRLGEHLKAWATVRPEPALKTALMEVAARLR